MSRRESRDVARGSAHRRDSSKETPPSFSENSPGHQELNLVLCGSDTTLTMTVSKLLRGKKTISSYQRGVNEVCVKKEEKISGRQLSVVELPALSGLSEEEVMRQTLRSITLCHPGVHAFLFIVHAGPLNNDEKAEIEMIQKIFDSKQHFILLFTSAISVGEFATEFVKFSSESQRLISRCGGQYRLMGLNEPENSRQIPDLLDYIENMKTEPYSPQMYVKAQENRVRRETEEKYEEELKRMEDKIKELQVKEQSKVSSEKCHFSHLVERRSEETESMDSTISKKIQSLTTAEDMRDQTKLMMQPYANWEEYLTPAPLSIAIMGELVFISSTTDFSVNKNAPKGGYKFIKYPESFRACLMQVCYSVWWAFNEAHKSMDQIRLHTAQVPDYMKTAVKILFQGNDEVVKAHLPDQMDNIRDVADECLKLSTATGKRFTDVINIIQELLEACVNAEHFYGEEMNDIKKILEESKLREQREQETQKRTVKALSAIEKELDQAQENYKKAVDSLPSGWEKIHMDTAGGLAQSVTVLINGVTSLIAHPVRNTTTNIADTLSHIRDQRSVEDVVAEIHAYSKSAEILVCVQEIQQLMNVNGERNEIDWMNLYDQRSKHTVTDFIAGQLNRISEDLMNVSDCSAKQKAQTLCKQATTICKKLEKYAPDGKCDEDKSIGIIDEVKELIKLAQVFDCKCKDITNSPAISPMPPMMNKERNRSENMSPSQRASENARFAIEQTRAQMNKTRETYEKCVENLEKNHEELTDILVTMRNCKSKEIDFKTTVEMLVKAMDAMGRVKEQWEKMVYFFQMISYIVKANLSKSLNNCVSTSKKTQALSYNTKHFGKDLLYIQAFQVSDIASLVHMISAAYTDVSNKYLMDCVSSLGKLMVMDKSKPEFGLERQQLQNSCDKAQKSILRLVLKNKEEFDRKSTARLERIDQELLAILPAAPPEQIKSIQEDVQAGFTEEEEEEEASYY